MANPERAEVELPLPRKIDGLEAEKLVLVLRTAETLELEARFERKFGVIARMLEKGDCGFRDIYTFVEVGLARRQPGLTKAQLCDIIDVLGPVRLLQAVGRAIELAFPALAEADKGGAAEGKAQGGTGGSSGERPSPPA